MSCRMQAAARSKVWSQPEKPQTRENCTEMQLHSVAVGTNRNGNEQTLPESDFREIEFRLINSLKFLKSQYMKKNIKIHFHWKCLEKSKIYMPFKRKSQQRTTIKPNWKKNNPQTLLSAHGIDLYKLKRNWCGLNGLDILWIGSFGREKKREKRQKNQHRWIEVFVCLHMFLFDQVFIFCLRGIKLLRKYFNA